MPRYLIHTKYSAQGSAGLIQEGYANRRVTATKSIESVGGKVEHWMWLDRTTWDFAGAVEMPSYQSCLGMFSAAWASGAFDRLAVSEIFDDATMDGALAVGLEWRAPGAS